jgi:hypothetical protein
MAETQSAEQQLFQFASRQIRTKAERIAKETASESVGITAKELVEDLTALDKAIDALFADTPKRGRKA